MNKKQSPKKKKEGPSPLKDQAPWVTFKAAAFLEDHLNKNMTVHEWGSGGSTLFFAKRCRHVTSIEHHPTWLANLRARIKELGFKNITLHLVKPSIGGGSAPGNSLSGFVSTVVGGSLKNYCQKIEGEHDIVMVDGRARPSCVSTGFKHVKPGGFLILDNAERDLYQLAIDHMDKLGWERHDWRGLASYSDGRELLTLGWRRPCQ